MQPPLLSSGLIRVAGGLLILTSLPVLLDSFARFAIQGLGTPAPVFPTKHLIVTGLYRYVRNPMYIAVTALIEGQGLLLGNNRVIEYGAIVYVAFFLFVLSYEEPRLRASFPQDYKKYCANVHRWVPRIRPWNGASADPHAR